MGIRFIWLVLCLVSPILAARPISYSGGSTLMAFTERAKHSVYYHYSPTYQYSLGVEGVRNRISGDEHSYVRLTYLLNRKNTQHSQRNLYLQSGIDPVDLDHHFYGVHGDWETRRLFSGFGYKYVNDQGSDYEEQFVQLGVAPYVGNYGDLHTWLMLKSKKNTLFGSWSNYPVIRLFKGNVFAELGYSDRSHWDAHLMYRF